MNMNSLFIAHAAVSCGGDVDVASSWKPWSWSLALLWLEAATGCGEENAALVCCRMDTETGGRLNNFYSRSWRRKSSITEGLE